MLQQIISYRLNILGNVLEKKSAVSNPFSFYLVMDILGRNLQVIVPWCMYFIDDILLVDKTREGVDVECFMHINSYFIYFIIILFNLFNYYSILYEIFVIIYISNIFKIFFIDGFRPKKVTSGSASFIRQNSRHINRYNAPYISWKKILKELCDMWFREFEKEFYWLPQRNDKIKKILRSIGGLTCETYLQILESQASDHFGLVYCVIENINIRASAIFYFCYKFMMDFWWVIHRKWRYDEMFQISNKNLPPEFLMNNPPEFQPIFLISLILNLMHTIIMCVNNIQYDILSCRKNIGINRSIKLE
ncbi:hypothetical protein IEQ34_000202 [Dendrobium chrysotoxum]|uniref:Reverse transcriptase domain-containing protein n=1 Tax=Dendrobium chrysotoxum TaxID=161865 RepID=A0AAV7HRS2_DENCH|nr:hypothetical protein IEQ34_000202 [Dendrobium chrysotoxum]